VLQEQQISAERIGTAELLVSELVTNAVKTTGGTRLPAPCQTANDHYRLIGLRLSLIKRSVVIEVRDGSDKPPVLQEQSVDSEGGRGLVVVESMSSQWSYFPLSSGGKIVWCELRVTRPAETDDVRFLPAPLPRRIRGSRPGVPTVVMTDPGVASASPGWPGRPGLCWGDRAVAPLLSRWSSAMVASARIRSLAASGC
jgi:hypothetical protein